MKGCGKTIDPENFIGKVEASVMKILIVDDDQTDRVFLEALLRGHGYVVDGATNGAAALERLRRERFDLVISDILMPLMDGFQLCKACKSDESLRTIPILMYSGTYTDGKDEELALRLGVERFLHKPAEPVAMAAIVAETLGKAPAERRPPPLPPPDEEKELLQLYSQRLVYKLERKMLDLRESEEKFRQITETIREVFWITDPGKSTMLYVSPYYETIWGRSCASLLAEPRAWIDAIHPEDRERVLQAALTKQALGTYREEYRILRPDGTLRWILDQAFPVRDEKGDVVRLVGVAEDITERKKLEAQLIQAQKMEAYGILAGGVAHDFNNILGVIMMQAEMARLKFGQIEGLDLSLEQIGQAAQRAAGLTRQLLLFSRRQPMVPAQLEIARVVGDLLKMLQRLIGEDIAIHTQFDPGVWPIVGDSVNIDQVVMNLVVNARDAMPRGGALTLRLENRIIDAETSRGMPGSRPGRFVVLAVTDTGTGMDEATEARLFEPFFTTKESGKGTGLGLAVVFGIMQQHQGWIGVESTPGKGTTMSCYFPAASGLQEEIVADVPALSSLQGKGELILIVEDERTLREPIEQMLRQSGYTVFAVASVKEARALFVGEARAADLVFSDVVLPDGSGVALVGDFLKTKPDLAVLLCSGYTDQKAEWPAIQEHGYEFIQKPYTVGRMLAAVRKALGE